MRVNGIKRKLIALAGLAILAALTWTTIGPGRIRLVGIIILGGFALRIALTKEPPREEDEVQEEDGSPAAGQLPAAIQSPAERV